MRMTAQDEQQPQADKDAEGQESPGRSEYRLAPGPDGLAGFPGHRVATLDRRPFASRLRHALTLGSGNPTRQAGGRNGR